MEKICFIMCVNDDMHYAECLLYLSQLRVPDGIEVEVLEIRDAISMTAGYQEGMEASGAKYKVYMHQDTRIVNKNFIYDILSIFRADESIGMIGAVGCPKLPVDGMMWHGDRIGIMGRNMSDEAPYDVQVDGYAEVEAIDGYIMVTQYDLPWRMDLFDGWDFYDVSQSMEFAIQGFKVVVPNMPWAWVLHEEEACMSLWNYDKYRRIFLEHYGDKCKRVMRRD